MKNLEIYLKVKDVPTEAKKSIGGGRLKGMTDINPMWRIKTLTETFGVCGIGWKYEIIKREIIPGGNGEIAAFVDILLYINVDNKWSEGIPGTGGSMFVAKERNGLYTSDECFKMALTDALSVACKALGMGASVYWDKDRTKYNTSEETTPATIETKTTTTTNKSTSKSIVEYTRELAISAFEQLPNDKQEEIKGKFKSYDDMTDGQVKITYHKYCM